MVASSGQLRTKAALNHESRGSYSFTMSVTDNKDIHGNADTIVDDTISVTVTVSDVDETPEVSGPIAVDFEEGGTGNVATYTFADPDQKGIDLVLSGADSEHFTLYSNGDLIFNEPPDFEEKSQYRVTIEAREQGDGTRHRPALTSPFESPTSTNPACWRPMWRSRASARRCGSTWRTKTAASRSPSGSGKGVNPTAPAARWTARRSPTGRP